ncbi:MAG: FG-GAP-like repeat-containing protein [Gemmatimonadetes bacterium]|nr:FG-GAP-like repeat-containing protein [Gemmatimonadota bacterium]
MRRIDPFPVLDEHGTAYTHPFLGGFDVPRPQFVDIDGDGDLDLFVQERSNQLMFLENTGTARAPEFVWRTDRWLDLDIGEWSRFADPDHDGDLDLLAEQPYSYIRYYRNDGTARSPRFVLAADSVPDANGRPVFSDRQNIPAITDIDCDGVLDLFLGRVDGTVSRYEQVPASRTEPVPAFAFVTDRFEGIEIVTQFGSMHGANSMAFADADGDGDMDLFWGDFFEAGLLFIENAGTCTTPFMQLTPVRVPRADSLETSGYNAPYLADIDGDGDLDLFIGVLGGAYNPNRTASDNFWFYERMDDESYRLRTRRFLNAIDVGSESVPTFADIDGDGDLDLIVANKIDPRTLRSSRLYIFENRGTPAAPVFALADTIDVGSYYHLAPVFVDLDGDGDLDMLAGTWNNDVQVFRNEGSRTELRLVHDSAAAIRIPRGSNTVPALADLDGDGDLDLVIGEAVGSLNFFRNTGTRTAPVFTLEAEDWLGIDVGRRAFPAFVDLDGDGDLDLVIGREEGGGVVYRNTGTAKEPRFQLDPQATLPLPHLGAPAFADLDGDGDPDLISGGLSGGLVYRERASRR